MNTELTNKFDEFEEYDDFSNLDTSNLLVEILTKPSLVFRYLFKNDSQKYIWSLMIAAGMANSFEKAISKASGNPDYILGYIFGGLLAGALFGWISFYISAWILSGFGGSFLSGRATSEEFRTVLVWGSIPSTASIVFSILLFIVYGSDSFNMNAEADMIEAIVITIVGLIQVGLSIWSLYIITQGVILVQKFSVGKALLNVLGPLIIFIVIIALIFGAGFFISEL